MPNNNPWDKMRDNAVRTIRDILTLANTDRIETGELNAGRPPVIHQGRTPGTDYTLESVTAHGNTDIIIESSCKEGYRNDFHTDLDTFTLEKIAEFLKENKETILDNSTTFSKEQRELIAETINTAFLNIFSDNQIRSAAIDRVLPYVMERIVTDADWSNLKKNEIVVGDVSIALQSVLTDYLDI